MSLYYKWADLTLLPQLSLLNPVQKDMEASIKNLWDPDLYSKAWNFATQAHEGQTYGGSQEGMRVPYINHIGSVAMEIALVLSISEQEYNANLAIQCALLHDVIEDTHYTYQDITEAFGQDVAKGVSALSKDKNLPSKLEQMLDSLKRIKQQPQEVWMVKLADRITNLYHPPFYWSAQKIVSYSEEAKLIYQELSSCNPQLASRLLFKIEKYGEFAEGRA